MSKRHTAAYLLCAHPETTVVMIWDEWEQVVAYYTMDGHNFGLAAAVLSFNRVTQLVATVSSTPFLRCTHGSLLRRLRHG